MKKILVLILMILVFGVSACKSEDPKEVINQSDVDYVNSLIELIPEEVTENDRTLIENTRIAYDQLNEEEKKLITDYERLTFAESVIAAIDEEKRRLEEEEQAIKDLLVEYEETLDELIPDEVTDNISLPLEYVTEKGRIVLTWRTSDVFTFSNLGVVIPGRKDINVDVTTEMIFIPNDSSLPRNIKHTFIQSVKVKAIDFDPLPSRNLTFAYAYGGTSFSEEAIATIDVINHAFSTIVNGEVAVGGSGREQLLELRKRGVRVSLCIGGYDEGAIPFSSAAATTQGRIKLAQSIVKAIEKYHFDGVDIDWEYPGFQAAPGIGEEEDKENYTLFIEELRRQVKFANKDYLVTAALPGGPFTSSRYNIGDLNNHLDYYLLMTYDLHGSNVTSHHTALYKSPFTINGCSVDETINNYVNKGASRNKLVVGAAFYGRSFNLNYQGNPVALGSATYRSSVDYKNIVNNFLSKVNSGEVVRYWDDTAKAPYLYNQTTNTFITYDDPESIRYKIEYIKSQGLAGIMFWEFSQDNGDLIRTIYQYM